MVKDYFKKIGARRFWVMLIGNVILALGVAVFKFSGLGNDPFNGMAMGLADRTGIIYGNFVVMINIILLIVELIFGRSMIGIGTLVNAGLQGYIATFFYNMMVEIWGAPDVFWQRVIIVCIGVIVASLGLSMYQTADVGIAPWDSISIIMSKRWPRIPYFWHRMSNDALAALICFLSGGIVGLGTLICAFGLGPVAHFFSEKFSKRLVGAEQK